MSASLFIFQVSFVAGQAQTTDQPFVLFAGMPSGAKKLLSEKADPPAAPLRLIRFRDTGGQGGPKGQGYGVDPLQMSIVRLQLKLPEERRALDKETSVSASDRGQRQGALSVKSIHQHVGDTVYFHGGTPNESVTPVVKPPGVHILDTVTRVLVQNSGGGFSKKIATETPNESIARSVANLAGLKNQLPDQGKKFAVPTQNILDKLQNLDINRSSDSAGSPVKIAAQERSTTVFQDVDEPDVSKPDVTKPDVTKPDVTKPEVTKPNVTKPDVTKPDVTKPEVTNPDVTQPDVVLPAVAQPDINKPDANGRVPNTAQPDANVPATTQPNIADKLSGIVDIAGNQIPTISNLFPDLNVPEPGQPYPAIDFDDLNKDLDDMKSKVDASVSVDDLKGKINDQLEPVAGKISNDLNAGIGKLNVRVDTDLDMMAGRVASAVGKAFTAVQSQLKQQGADERSKANAVNVPAKDCHLLGPCWLTGETSESKSKRASAKSQKDAYNKTADKFYAAAAKMPAQKATAQASIYQKFGMAEESVDSSLSTKVVVPATAIGSSDASKEEPGGANGSSSGVAPDNVYAAQVNDDSSVVALVSIGSLTEIYSATGSINAAIGDSVRAEQYIAVVDSRAGDLTVGSLTLLGVDTGSINAGIGYQSSALQVIDSIFDRSEEASTGTASFATLNEGEVNVSLAANSKAEMLVTSILGSVKGHYSAKSAIFTPINVTLGSDTSAITHLGAWQGVVEGSGNLFLQSTAALSAAIGGSTNSVVRLASQGTEGHSTNLNISVVSEGALAAPLGYDATAVIEVGNVDGVTGSATVNVVTGPAISAALGGSTTATNRIANLQQGTRVGGTYNNTVKSGGLLAFALGDDTTAINALGSVEGDIGGSATISVQAGEVATGTVGVRTEAETYLGSVLANVGGNVDINVVVGAVNTFAVGLSSGKDIYAKTYVGNVTSNQGSANISASAGAIFNLGFGLIIDLGALGTLDFSKQGCVKIANHGSAPC
ncbi:MAG: hypothetical protein HOH17_07885 [Halieaceae bacterium]|nr:hypothetical protein [Halieaceae bacterium]